MKFHDVKFTTATVPIAARIRTLLTIPQGTTEIQRIGRKCTIKSISIRYHGFLQNGSVQNGHDQIRVMLVLDKQTNGDAFNATDLLETDEMDQYRNLANSSRFTILWDKWLTLNYTAAGGNGTDIESMSWGEWHRYHKKLNIPIEYNSTVGAITEIKTNNLLLVEISENGIAESFVRIRIRFMG